MKKSAKTKAKPTKKATIAETPAASGDGRMASHEPPANNSPVCTGDDVASPTPDIQVAGIPDVANAIPQASRNDDAAREETNAANIRLPSQVFYLAVCALGGHGEFFMDQTDDSTTITMKYANSLTVTHVMPGNILSIKVDGVVDGIPYRFSGTYTEKSGGMVGVIRDGMITRMHKIYSAERKMY